MLEESLEKIIRKHRNEGMIEECNLLEFIDNQQVLLNIFTLKLTKLASTTLDIDYLNAQLLRKIKTNPSLYKEIREFNLIFRFFKKLNIKNGYIKKSETPDFILEREGKRGGVEVTRIYTGNDWVAEKVHNDILAYKLKDKKLSDYISNKKYTGRIITYSNPGGIVVKAVKDKSLKEEEIIQIKNKIFEKIRKQMDDYNKYDYNYIFAEIVFTEYEALNEIENLNREINFLISHLDGAFGNDEFHLILKMGNNWVDFDLKDRSYTLL